MVTCYIAGVDVEWPLMKVIITFTFWCNNLWKSKFMAVENPGKLRELFFSYFVATLVHLLCPLVCDVIAYFLSHISPCGIVTLTFDLLTSKLIQWLHAAWVIVKFEFFTVTFTCLSLRQTLDIRDMWLSWPWPSSWYSCVCVCVFIRLTGSENHLQSVRCVIYSGLIRLKTSVRRRRLSSSSTTMSEAARSTTRKNHVCQRHLVNWMIANLRSPV